MHNEKKELPEMYRTVLALLVFDEIPPLPLTGFIAETIDTHKNIFTHSTKLDIPQSL